MASLPIIHNSRTDDRTVRGMVLSVLANRRNPLQLTIPYTEIFERQWDAETIKMLKKLRKVDKNLVNKLRRKQVANDWKVDLLMRFEYEDIMYSIDVPSEVVPKGGIYVSKITKTNRYDNTEKYVVSVPEDIIMGGFGAHVERYVKLRDMIHEQNATIATEVEEWLKQRSDGSYTIRTWQQAFWWWPELRSVIAPSKYNEKTGNSRPRISKQQLAAYEPPSDELRQQTSTLLTQGIMMQDTPDLYEDQPLVKAKSVTE